RGRRFERTIGDVLRLERLEILGCLEDALGLEVTVVVAHPRFEDVDGGVGGGVVPSASIVYEGLIGIAYPDGRGGVTRVAVHPGGERVVGAEGALLRAGLDALGDFG